MSDPNQTLIVLNVATLASVLAGISLVLRQHKIWVRMKERLNTLWFYHCKASGDPYAPLDNSSHHD